MNTQIKAIDFDAIDEYMKVPISFAVRERLVVLDHGRLGVQYELKPWIKDYDAYIGEGPPSYPARFDVSNWAVLGAFDDSRLVGGAILAFRCPAFDLLEGRDDLVHVVDIRIAREFRGQTVGRQLWHAAETWSRERGVTEIRVETQDINVPACRFYQAMGCTLISLNPAAYGPEIDEIQLIWGKTLAP